jgi:transposase-like protein
MDGSEANAAVIRGDNAEHGTAPVIRQVKCLNQVAGQDHRGLTRVTRPRLGCKSLKAAQSIPVGIALRDCRNDLHLKKELSKAKDVFGGNYSGLHLIVRGHRASLHPMAASSID